MAESLKDERSALVEANRWHPASEPPDSDRDILVVTKKGHFYVDMWTEDTGYDTAGDAATHWRELPAPPKAEVAI